MYHLMLFSLKIKQDYPQIYDQIVGVLGPPYPPPSQEPVLRHLVVSAAILSSLTDAIV